MQTWADLIKMFLASVTDPRYIVQDCFISVTQKYQNLKRRKLSWFSSLSGLFLLNYAKSDFFLTCNSATEVPINCGYLG